ncbi:MAG: DUF4157 domain-containing protein, partial [Candidatus Obscuribacterales bacterium]|nr:DUF4157 domain-containing protein [Steroidobacteraceae bacterium]
MHKSIARPPQANSRGPAKTRSPKPARQASAKPDHARWQVGHRAASQEAQADQAADRVANGAHNAASSLPTKPTLENEGKQGAESRRHAPSRQSLSTPPSDSSNGRPLDGHLGGRMTQAFGRSVDHVRVHADTSAANEARRLTAKAFTAGSHIYFADGQFRPDTRDGVRLLAHEVTHTLQSPSENVIRCAPDDEVVQQIIIYTDINQAVVVTDRGRHLYNLTDKTGLVAGDYSWEHEQGEVIDKKRGDGTSKLLSQPAGAGAGSKKIIDWRIAPTNSAQKSWGEYASSTFTMQVFDSADISGGASKGKGGKGSAAGQGASNKGTGQGTGGGGQPTPTEAEKEKKADDFMAALKAQGVGTGAPVSRDKVKELVGDMPADAMADFFKLFDQIQDKNPSSKSIEELLAYYAKLSPSQREVLRVNKVMAESLDETATNELPADVQLAMEVKANDTGKVATQLEGTNKSLAAIHAKVNAVDPDMAKNFEPLDPQKLTAFNQMLMLEGLLAGASQRSPAIEVVSKELMGNIGKIRSFI